MFGKNGWMIYRSSWPSLESAKQIIHNSFMSSNLMIRTSSRMSFGATPVNKVTMQVLKLLIKFYWDTQFGGWAKKNYTRTGLLTLGDFFCRVYADYSSVVTFDTTYRTNQYSMPLAMFVGFNNKLQNVVFGQALLRDERADTFEWLFKQFRACMGGKDPIVIFTGMYAMTCAS